MDVFEEALTWYGEQETYLGPMLREYRQPYDGNYVAHFAEVVYECTVCGGTGEVSGEELIRLYGLAPCLEAKEDIQAFKEEMHICPLCGGSGEIIRCKMDFSEKYAKMCEKAKEIQEMWEPQIGDWIQERERWGKQIRNWLNPKLVVEVHESAIKVYLPKSDYEKTELLMLSQLRPNYYNQWWVIWLPRQDQLLEIWRKHDEVLNQIEELTPIDMHYTFSSIVDFLEKHFWWQKYASFEQTVLAFVMYDLYKKIWDEQKEEWVKEKEV